MSEPKIMLVLDNPPRAFQPGDVLSGEYHLLEVAPRDIKAAELSVLWYTEGKGDEDLAVHFFERLEPTLSMVDLRQPRPFRTQLPPSPLSYAGLIVKVHWCVRVRIFLAHGKEIFAEQPFQLGQVESPVEVFSTPETAEVAEAET